MLEAASGSRTFQSLEQSLKHVFFEAYPVDPSQHSGSQAATI